MIAVADCYRDLQVAVCEAGDAGDLHCVWGSTVCVSAVAPQCRAGWIGPHQCPQPYRSAFAGMCNVVTYVVTVSLWFALVHQLYLIISCSSVHVQDSLLVESLSVMLLATCCVIILRVSLLCCRCSCDPIQSNMESGTITSAYVITC